MHGAVVVVGGGVIGCAIAEPPSSATRSPCSNGISSGAALQAPPPATSAQLAFDEKEAVKLKASGGNWLDAMACRDAEPSLTHDVLGAVLRQEGYIAPPRFVRALARAAASRGAEIREGTPATGFVVGNGEVQRVIANDGAIEGDWFVIAAGPWSKEVAMRAGVDVEVRPQRGQLALLNPARAGRRRHGHRRHQIEEPGLVGTPAQETTPTSLPSS